MEPPLNHMRRLPWQDRWVGAHLAGVHRIEGVLEGQRAIAFAPIHADCGSSLQQAVESLVLDAEVHELVPLKPAVGVGIHAHKAVGELRELLVDQGQTCLEVPTGDPQGPLLLADPVEHHAQFLQKGRVVTELVDVARIEIVPSHLSVRQEEGVLGHVATGFLTNGLRLTGQVRRASMVRGRKHLRHCTHRHLPRHCVRRARRAAFGDRCVPGTDAGRALGTRRWRLSH
mmetsp:Transcript_83286/g.214539  ORF Transcript_83286/g.214539 Transcript_83286/m.214539 type:complete len:229 (-) Transcript_83286:13-699(-)